MMPLLLRQGKNMKDKIKTYINFAIKSGECAIGTDKILKLKRAEVIIVSPELSNNALNKIKNKNISKIITISEVFPEGVLAIAIINKNLADAIVNEAD